MSEQQSWCSLTFQVLVNHLRTLLDCCSRSGLGSGSKLIANKYARDARSAVHGSRSEFEALCYLASGGFACLLILH